MNARTPTLPQLRAFLAVAEFLHFGAAAADLEMSQPALSAALTGCEEALNVRLVERTTRRVMLTEAGQHLLPEAKSILRSVESFTTHAERFARLHNGIRRIGVIPTVAPYLLPVFLRMLRTELPRLEPHVHELRTTDIVQRLDSGAIDVGICALPAPGNVCSLPLYSESLLLAIPKGSALAARNEWSPSELADEDILLLEEGHCLREQALEVCQPAAPRSGSLSSAAAIHTLLQLVEAGLGVALVPETAVKHEGKGMAISFRRITASAASRDIALIHRRGDERSQEHNEMADLIKKSVRQRQLPAQIQQK